MTLSVLACNSHIDRKDVQMGVRTDAMEYGQRRGRRVSSSNEGDLILGFSAKG